jgi:sterol 3beta-glucosyltransferase
MKILLISIGTRGDMEPFLAIGELLKEKGHEVLCVFPEMFKNLAEESNLKFASLGKKYTKTMNSDAWKAFMGGSTGLRKLFSIISLSRESSQTNKELIFKQYEIIKKERPDRILYSGKSHYPMIWEINNRGKTILISPFPYVHYVKGHTHIGFHSNFGSFFNKLTYSFADFGLVMVINIAIKLLNIQRKITKRKIKKTISSRKAIYTISPTLFPEPEYWNKNIKVLGYHERDKTINWKPEKNLEKYLAKHDKILFLTFGSMINPNPGEKTRVILDILEKHNIPAIINTASGGLIKPSKYNTKLFHFVKQVPYDWIFPKIYAAIHHGGSGTTHAAIKHGCATMVIPHMIDQYAWNDIVNDLDIGPVGIAISKIKSKNLEPKILDLFLNQSYKTKVLEISKKMKAEDFKERLYETIIE